MRRVGMRIFAWMLLSCLALAAPAAETAYRLSVVTDPPQALYAVGQQATFRIRLEQAGQPVDGAEVVCQLDKDGVPPAEVKHVKLQQGTGSVQGTLAEPGFLRCRVGYTSKGKETLWALAGAGFDPQKIPPSLPVPEDFDAFWARQKARLASVPMTPVLTPVKPAAEGVESFDVQIPCVPPRPVSGYFSRPAEAAPKSLPAMLYVHGAGVGGSSLIVTVQAAAKFHALAMDINAHGIPNGQAPAYYTDLNAGELKDYRLLGRQNREECYFLGMFLRLVRALDFLASQPQWDGKTLIVCGSSQGGGQAIAAAGLDSRVSFISAGVPAICDHSGRAVGRINGWPKLVPDVDGKPDPQILEVARYFDGMNFATRAKAEGLFSVGLIDATCPPSSVYAAYNNFPGRKQIVIEPLMGHAQFPRMAEATAEAITKHIAGRKP